MWNKMWKFQFVFAPVGERTYQFTCHQAKPPTIWKTPFNWICSFSFALYPWKCLNSNGCWDISPDLKFLSGVGKSWFFAMNIKSMTFFLRSKEKTSASVTYRTARFWRQAWGWRHPPPSWTWRPPTRGRWCWGTSSPAQPPSFQGPPVSCGLEISEGRDNNSINI